jgi:membrane protease YdiL (CAAX protease family)
MGAISPWGICLTVSRAALRAPIFVSLALILAYPPFAIAIRSVCRDLVPVIGEIEARVVTEAAAWLYGIAVLAIALFWERRTPASIGLRRPTFASLGFGIGGAAAMAGAIILGGFVVYGLLHQPEHEDAQMAAMVGSSAVYGICLAVRGGVMEEILFRGLAIEQLTVLTGRRWLSAFLATLVFALGHALNFDWAQLVPIAAVSAVVVGLYLWRHDLWANIIAHTAIDTVAVLSVVFQAHNVAH